LQHTVVNNKPNIETNEMASLLEKQIQMSQQLNELPEDIIETLMKETYALQRQSLEEALPFKEINTQWPFLFVDTHFRQHFETLTNRQLDLVSKNYVKFEKVIIDYLKNQNNSQIQKIYSEKGDATGQHECVFELLAAFFKENVDFLFRKFKIGTTKDELLLTYVPEGYLTSKKTKKTLGPIICQIGKFANPIVFRAHF
jgi:hypothetical protein